MLPFLAGQLQGEAAGANSLAANSIWHLAARAAEGVSGNVGWDGGHNPGARERVHERVRKLGFVEYKGI
jgi:hypothetical protein